MSAEESHSAVGAANLSVGSVSQAPSHRRHKRFHVPSEALGHGYFLFELPHAPGQPPEPETDVLSEKERAQEAAANGVLISLMLLFCILFGFYVVCFHPELITKIWTWLPPNESKPPW
jgi:hypothetical protein